MFCLGMVIFFIDKAAIREAATAGRLALATNWAQGDERMT